ncbi:hypothetical protein ACS0TY_001672 [Phlomoides rotata]
MGNHPSSPRFHYGGWIWNRWVTQYSSWLQHRNSLLQNRVKGPKWLPFVIGLPPLLMYSTAGAAFGGYALLKFTQLSVTSYYASSSASHYGISLLTGYVEDNHSSRIQNKQLRWLLGGA